MFQAQSRNRSHTPSTLVARNNNDRVTGKIGAKALVAVYYPLKEPITVLVVQLKMMDWSHHHLGLRCHLSNYSNPKPKS